METESKTQDKGSPLKGWDWPSFLILLGFILFGVWAISPLWVRPFFKHFNAGNEPGEISIEDVFAGLNVLVSGFAFLVIGCQLWLQRKSSSHSEDVAREQQAAVLRQMRLTALKDIADSLPYFVFKVSGDMPNYDIVATNIGAEVHYVQVWMNDAKAILKPTFSSGYADIVRRGDPLNIPIQVWPDELEDELREAVYFFISFHLRTGESLKIDYAFVLDEKAVLPTQLRYEMLQNLLHGRIERADPDHKSLFPDLGPQQTENRVLSLKKYILEAKKTQERLERQLANMEQELSQQTSRLKTFARHPGTSGT